jgi:SPP1 family predicted phage head-tail adaptor
VIGAGRLRERVVIQRATTGDDGYGNTVTGWVTHLTVWADVRETLGKERVDAGLVEASATATVRVRASAATRGLTAADRMVARGWTWNIRSIVPVGNDRAMLDLLVERGVAA